MRNVECRTTSPQYRWKDLELPKFEEDNAQVRLLQERFELTPDGIAGAETREAVRNFQKQSGLKATGRVSDDTVKALNQDQSPEQQFVIPALKMGHRGEKTRLLQNLLNQTGTQLTADGIFGIATSFAVKGLQENLDLEPRGEMDQTTLDKVQATSEWNVVDS